MKTFIERPLYIKKIENFINTDLIKVITGQRRCGKSYLLFQIIDILKTKYHVNDDEIIYVNKEDLKRDFIEDYHQLYDTIKGYHYIFIDEIQDVFEREKAIRSLQSQGGYDIYITGSNSNLLSGELATFLGGRYINIPIYPLNYTEFLSFHNLNDSEENFELFLRFGGLPYLKNLTLKEDVVQQYLSDIVDTIILKDVISREKIRNIDFYKNLIIYLARETGNIFSAKKISDYLKNQKISISTNTVLEYLNNSKNACFLHQVQRYDLKGKKMFELMQKCYFSDIGIKNALVGGYSKLHISGILENVVYMDLLSKGWEISIGKIGSKEVDFVCKKGEKTMYVQVAYLLESEETKNREFSSLLDINDSWKKFVLSMDKNASGFINGIKRVNIRNFLLTIE